MSCCFSFYADLNVYWSCLFCVHSVCMSMCVCVCVWVWRKSLFIGPFKILHRSKFHERSSCCYIGNKVKWIIGQEIVCMFTLTLNMMQVVPVYEHFFLSEDLKKLQMYPHLILLLNIRKLVVTKPACLELAVCLTCGNALELLQNYFLWLVCIIPDLSVFRIL